MKPIIIDITERNGITRSLEPVSCGIPFARGNIVDAGKLYLLDDNGEEIAASFTPLAHWNDKSLKWVLIDFQINIDAYETRSIQVLYSPGRLNKNQDFTGISMKNSGENISVSTDGTNFILTSTGKMLLSSVQVGGQEVLSKPALVKLVDSCGDHWQPYIESYNLERKNTHRLIISYVGGFRDEDGRSNRLRFKARVHFYAGKGTIGIDFTIWNPQAAIHKQGVWDLGDEHSIFFKELYWEVAVAGERTCRYCLMPGDTWYSGKDDLMIYQDSSGGDNWQSPAHVNRHDKVPLIFKGYEVRSQGEVIARGKRATPIISLEGDSTICSCTLERFWQNFPKGISCRENTISMHLFPAEFSDVHELQGGEQKTHSMFIHFGNKDRGKWTQHIAALHYPLLPCLESEQFYRGGLAPRPVPAGQLSDEICKVYQHYINNAVQGDRTFASRREIIDEYGWRNFGELYADHEAVMSEGDTPFVSHYNNQYDCVKGGLFQFMRTGDPAWYQMASELADHVMDIDIYRTSQDRYEYNNGLFWHTDHHVPACTATHRTTSKKHFTLKDPRFVGGGPSYEHNYSSGFCYMFWMTGEVPYKECVLLFADYVICGLESPHTFIEWGRDTVKRIKYKLTSSGSTQFGCPYGLITGPGRGSGNGLNTLIDAYLVTGDDNFLLKAARLIRMCVGPDDEIESRNLLNPELRWMYLIFMQSLGRYLEVCVERKSWNADFHYARVTFVRYGLWMLENEYPYLDRPEVLEFPNETWAAQDIRKADILALAARYGKPDQQAAFLKKSRYFFEKCFEHLQRFGEDSYLTRPLAVVMTNGLTWMEMRRDLEVDDLPAYDVSLAQVENCQVSKSGDGEFKKLLKIAGKTSLRKEVSWLRNRLRSR